MTRWMQPAGPLLAGLAAGARRRPVCCFETSPRLGPGGRGPLPAGISGGSAPFSRCPASALNTPQSRVMWAPPLRCRETSPSCAARDAGTAARPFARSERGSDRSSWHYLANEGDPAAQPDDRPRSNGSETPVHVGRHVFAVVGRPAASHSPPGVARATLCSSARNAPQRVVCTPCPVRPRPRSPPRQAARNRRPVAGWRIRGGPAGGCPSTAAERRRVPPDSGVPGRASSPSCPYEQPRSTTMVASTARRNLARATTPGAGPPMRHRHRGRIGEVAGARAASPLARPPGPAPVFARSAARRSGGAGPARPEEESSERMGGGGGGE